MKEDQARRMAEEIPMPEKLIVRLANLHSEHGEFKTFAFASAVWREAIAATLVKLTQQGPFTTSEERALDLARYVYSRSNPHDSPQILLSAEELKTITETARPIPSQQEERVLELERQCRVMRNALTDIADEVYDSWTNGAKAQELAINALDAARSKEQGK